MCENNVEEGVRQIIREMLEIDDPNLDDDIEKDLGGDSLDAVEILMAAEEKFDVDIADDAASEIHTMRDLINAIIEARP